MAREIDLGQNVTIVTQEAVIANTVSDWKLTLDDGECAQAVYTVGGIKFSVILWDSTSNPTYTQAGQYTDEDIEERIKQLILNS